VCTTRRTANGFHGTLRRHQTFRQFHLNGGACVTGYSLRCLYSALYYPLCPSWVKAATFELIDDLDRSFKALADFWSAHGLVRIIGRLT
jgi:hypothetical protein